MQQQAKNPFDELTQHLDVNFKRVGQTSQWRDDHITIDVYGGDIRIYNNLNMRYTHRRFTTDLYDAAARDGVYVQALEWLRDTYTKAPQPIPEKWQVRAEPVPA